MTAIIPFQTTCIEKEQRFPVCVFKALSTAEFKPFWRTHNFVMIVVNFSLPNKLSLLIFAFWFLAVFRRNLFCPFLCASRIKTGHYYPENIFGTFTALCYCFFGCCSFRSFAAQSFCQSLATVQFVFSGFGGYFGAWNVVFLLTSVSQTMLSDGKVLTADDARAFDYKSICTDGRCIARCAFVCC